MWISNRDGLLLVCYIEVVPHRKELARLTGPAASDVYQSHQLTAPPVLAYPDFDQPFQLYTDASGKGLGAVLEQQQKGVSHPVAFASRTLSKHEQQYGITELETLAVVWGLRHFRAYLYGHRVTVITDHAPVKALLNTRHPSGKLACWAESVAELDVEILYRPGRKHSNADALSRSPLALPMPNDSVAEDVQVATVAAGDSDTEVLDESRELLELQLAELYYAAMIRFLQSETLPGDEQVAKWVLSEKNNFVVIEKLLYCVNPMKVDWL